jgi:hypothetical protein
MFFVFVAIFLPNDFGHGAAVSTHVFARPPTWPKLLLAQIQSRR